MTDESRSIVNMSAAQLTRADAGRNVTVIRGACRIDGTLTFVRQYGMNMIEIGIIGYGTVRCFRDTPVTLS